MSEVPATQAEPAVAAVAAVPAAAVPAPAPAAQAEPAAPAPEDTTASAPTPAQLPPEPVLDPWAALPELTAAAAGVRAEGSAPEATAAVAVKAMAQGEALLFTRTQPDDAELCTKFFKLALEMDPLNLRAAKLLQLAMMLYVDPTDADAAREVDQLKKEVAAARSQAAAALAGGGAAVAAAAPSSRSEIAPGFQIVCPGVRKQVKNSGDGVTIPKAGDRLTMHYTGTLTSTGAKFDSSVDRGEPFEFTIGVGEVIKGWDEGVILMSLGEKAVLHIASEMAYGEEDVGNGAIPPGSDLDFEVELLAVGDLGAESGAAAADDQSLTDAFMGGIFGGAWSFLTGADMLPTGRMMAEQNMPHAWNVTGSPEAKYDGRYVVDPENPIANEKVHYVNQHGMHMYYRGG